MDESTSGLRKTEGHLLAKVVSVMLTRRMIQERRRKVKMSGEDVNCGEQCGPSACGGEWRLRWSWWRAFAAAQREKTVYNERAATNTMKTVSELAEAHTVVQTLSELVTVHTVKRER